MKPNGPEASESEYVVEGEDVHVSFGEKKVLTGVSFRVRKGETVALLGESGGGKSVLLKVLLGLLPPTRGRSRLFGVDVTGLRDKDMEPLRKRMAVVYQAGALFSGLTVAENVALELREVLRLPEAEIARRVKDSLAAVGLGSVEPDLMPDELSGGMKKRLAVARAVAPGPEVIFYDEPTSGLDPINSARILRLIRDLGESYGATSLVVTHDVRGAMSIADRMVLLYDGKIAFDGTPEEFAASKDPRLSDFQAAGPGPSGGADPATDGAPRGRPSDSGQKPPRGSGGVGTPVSRRLRGSLRGGTPAASSPKEGTL